MFGYVNIESLDLCLNFSYKDGKFTLFSYNSSKLRDDLKFDFDIMNDCNNHIKPILAYDLENLRYVIFFVEDLPRSKDDMFWVSSDITVRFYIVLKKKIDIFKACKLIFSFPELNHFFSLNKAIKKDFIVDPIALKMETVKNDEIKEKFSFYNKEQRVDCEFGISQGIEFRKAIPLKLESYLCCNFNPTSNIDFILSLFWLWYCFFMFIYFRQNINLGSVKLGGEDKNGKKIYIGDFYLIRNIELQQDDDKLYDTLEFLNIKKHFPQLIQLFANKNVYVEHFPVDKKSSKTITISNFILFAAAFEWTFESTYKNINSKSKTDRVINDILTAIDGIELKKYNSRQKRVVKHSRKLIENSNNNFESKIIYALKDNENIITPFIKYIYSLNRIEIDNNIFSQIAEDLQAQRNTFAHGQIDRKMKENIVLETAILKLLIHCMVFKQAGYVEDIDIYTAISKIFNYHIPKKLENFNQELDSNN